MGDCFLAECGGLRVGGIDEVRLSDWRFGAQELVDLFGNVGVFIAEGDDWICDAVACLADLSCVEG